MSWGRGRPAIERLLADGEAQRALETARATVEAAEQLIESGRLVPFE